MSWQQKGEDCNFYHICIEHGNLLHTVPVIMQMTKKQEEVPMVTLCTFVVYPLLGHTKG